MSVGTREGREEEEIVRDFKKGMEVIFKREREAVKNEGGTEGVDVYVRQREEERDWKRERH